MRTTYFRIRFFVKENKKNKKGDAPIRTAENETNFFYELKYIYPYKGIQIFGEYFYLAV